MLLDGETNRTLFRVLRSGRERKRIASLVANVHSRRTTLDGTRRDRLVSSADCKRSRGSLLTRQGGLISKILP